MKQPILPPKGVVYGENFKSLPRILDRNVSLVLWQRGIPNFINGWLELLKWPLVSNVQFSVNFEKMELFEGELTNLINSWGRRNPDVSDWIIEDIFSITSQFVSSTGVENLTVKLSPSYFGASDDMIYEKHLKLMTSYGSSDLVWGGEPEQFFEIPPLDIAIIKGKAWPGVENLFHFAGTRSPDNGKRNILLEIEYLD